MASERPAGAAANWPQSRPVSERGGRSMGRNLNSKTPGRNFAAHDACRQSKICCSGGNPCVACQWYPKGCNYSPAGRLGRPKDSKNKRTLMQQYLRPENEQTTGVNEDRIGRSSGPDLLQWNSPDQGKLQAMQQSSSQSTSGSIPFEFDMYQLLNSTFAFKEGGVPEDSVGQDMIFEMDQNYIWCLRAVESSGPCNQDCSDQKKVADFGASRSPPSPKIIVADAIEIIIQREKSPRLFAVKAIFYSHGIAHHQERRAQTYSARNIQSFPLPVAIIRVTRPNAECPNSGKRVETEISGSSRQSGLLFHLLLSASSPPLPPRPLPLLLHLPFISFLSPHGSPVSSPPIVANASPPPPPLPPLSPPPVIATTSASGEPLRLPGQHTFKLGATAPVAAGAPAASSGPPASDTQARPPPSPGDGATLHELLHRVQKLEELSVTENRVTKSPNLHVPLGAGGGSSCSQPSPAGTHDWQSVLNKSRDWGRSRWMGAANELNAVIACYSEIASQSVENRQVSFHSPEASTLVTQAGDLLRKCKTQARSIKLGRPTRGLLPPGLGSVPPPRETADAMVELYLSSFESVYVSPAILTWAQLQRILHLPTFRAEYRKYWDNPEAITPILRLKVLLVIGIGSSLYDHGDRASVLHNIDRVQQWIYAAQTWLSGPLEKDRLDIPGLQIFCLTILARQLFSIGGDTIWISMGSLVHSAMQIGLHRDPKHLPTRSVLDAELRRRLWYTILEFVVQASLDSWMPPRISFDDFDTEPPSNASDDQLNESTVQFLPRDSTTETSIQLALIQSLPVRLRIVQLLNGLHSENSYERVLALSSELITALQECNRHAFTPFHRNLLDYLVRRFMIPMHYYFSNQARSNPLFHYSLKLSLDAALALVSPEPNPQFARLMAMGGGLFREGIRSATSAISLELLAHVETQRLNGTLYRTRQYREFLKQVVRDLIDLSEDRIRQGETNVKNHMFLSMILAQVEAVEANKTVEVEVARGARDSLGLCNTLLQTREQSSMSSEEYAAIAAMEIDGSQDLEGLGPGFDWESFFPDVASSQWIG
ncbi:fungal specific transcription factor domain-containing protein [Aspergillus homomorphus CBS 101889]|uniref:Xylanolytic transcriptional activator regulatory domain-containing protein n=1 Tax=Aspergillus homomorphus (strain CBS 101889) TaxID=1450537 RepID=A0A395I7Y8_ASPHC|nr:hypothetical protein BO97DRAFT_475061 [Aspergillus homomorphus CBS 101889]RAL16211.1 hypothetical protein BO97DRAFT_475061 [Aspergillus homomorphus CBS 101889]